MKLLFRVYKVCMKIKEVLDVLNFVIHKRTWRFQQQKQAFVEMFWTEKKLMMQKSAIKKGKENTELFYQKTWRPSILANYISTKNVTIGRHLRLKNVCRSDMKELLDTATVDYSKH